MAKKKEGGSNLGLIVTLVFFVLATVILGVTTYMGYSDQDAKQKEAKKATDEKVVAEKFRDWERFKANVLRTWAEGPSTTDKDAPADLASKLSAFVQNPDSAAGSDKAEFATLVKKLDKDMRWDPSKPAPSKTYASWIEEKQATINELKGQLKNARDTAAREKRERDEAEAEAAKKIAALNTALETMKQKSLEDRKVDQEIILASKDLLNKEGEQRAEVQKKLDTTAKELEKQSKLAKQWQAQVATLTRESKEAKETLSDTQARLAAMLEKSGQDPSTVATTAIDNRAAQALKDWNKDWRIVNIDKVGTMPYINLGSADGLVPQVTFSIHSTGPDGKLNPIAKGSLEVIKVIDGHLAQARVTSIRDSKADPILKGDKLFNPTWDPYSKKHVAVLGLSDLGGDGAENNEDLRKLLAKQNVEVDAIIDFNDKEPKVVGKGISNKTDYLILGDTLETAGHSKSRDKNFVTAYGKLERELKDKAGANGVTLISLKKYLEMIGYRSPKVVNTNTGRR